MGGRGSVFFIVSSPSVKWWKVSGCLCSRLMKIISRNCPDGIAGCLSAGPQPSAPSLRALHIAQGGWGFHCASFPSRGFPLPSLHLRHCRQSLVAASRPFIRSIGFVVSRRFRQSLNQVFYGGGISISGKRCQVPSGGAVLTSPQFKHLANKRPISFRNVPTFQPCCGISCSGVFLPRCRSAACEVQMQRALTRNDRKRIRHKGTETPAKATRLDTTECCTWPPLHPWFALNRWWNFWVSSRPRVLDGSAWNCSCVDGRSTICEFLSSEVWLAWSEIGQERSAALTRLITSYVNYLCSYLSFEISRRSPLPPIIGRGFSRPCAVHRFCGQPPFMRAT